MFGVDPARYRVCLDAIPAELKEFDQWVVWRYAVRDGKRTKPPYQTNGELASSTNPSTWTSFQLATSGLEAGGFDGIGFVLTPNDPYAAFDLDHVRHATTGELERSARELVETLDSYTEVTPSNEGLRILVRAMLPPGGRKRSGLEVYDEARYVTLTGHHLAGAPPSIEDRQVEVERVHADHFQSSFRPRPMQATAPVALDDAALLDRARSAKNGAAFDRLFRGDWSDRYTSQSEADLALCNALAFWTGGDGARVGRIFRSSGLMREKWEARHYADGGIYGERTIQLALANATESYKPAPRPSGNGRLPPEGGRREDPRPMHHFPFTDTGNAERFAARYGDRVRYDHRRRRWLVWKTHWWQPDADAEARRMAKSVARAILNEAAKIEDDEKRKLATKWAFESESRSRLDALLSLAQAEHPIADAGDNWDVDPWVLGVANGVVDLRTGDLRMGRPEDLITLHSDVRFDPGAECPRWLQFLEEVFAGDAEIIDYVHRAAGYSGTGDTSEQCFFEGWGSGENGKSTLLALLRETLGVYAYNMPFSTVELRGRQEQTFDLADLAGRRLVTASETNESARLNEARIKALTGEDPITARHPYHGFETFTPALKLWLGVNHRPQVDDDSHAFWRRVRLIPFAVRFDGDRRDNGLKGKLRAELPGILAWLVRGCLAWQRRGLGAPANVRAATEEYRQDSDKLADFLAARCINARDVSIDASALYQAYLKWAKDEGIRDREQLSSTAFGRRMGERFKRQRGTTGRRVYLGVALREAGQAAFSQDTAKAAETSNLFEAHALPENADPKGNEGLGEPGPNSSEGVPRLFSSQPRVAKFPRPGANLSYPPADELAGACQDCGATVDYYTPNGTPWCVQHGPGDPPP